MQISPTTSGVSFLENKLIINTELLDVNNYSFKLILKKGSNIQEKSFLLKGKPKFTLSNIDVTEGSLQDLSIAIDSGSANLTTLSFSNLEENFTLFSFAKNAALQSFLNRQRNNLPLSLSGSNSIKIETSAKYASEGVINFTLNTNSESYEYVVPYKINRAAGNPAYLNYRYISFRDSNYPSEQISTLKSNLTAMKTSMEPWRVAILTDYVYEDLYCSGTRVNVFESTGNFNGQSIHSCLKNRGDQDNTNSINVFSFSEVYSGSNQIGGIALGIQAGVVVGSDQSQVTAHEIGHVLGLFHTFETFFNYPLASRNVLGNNTQKIVHEIEGVPTIIDYASQPTNVTQLTLSTAAKINGDWLDGLFSYTSSGAEVIDFNYSGIIDDTDFDPYGNRKISLYLSSFIANFIPNANLPFTNGSLIYMSGGNQPENGISSGYACNKGSYNYSTKLYSPSCEVGARALTNASIKNQMSYWSKYEHGVFTPGQKQRMDKVLLAFPQYGVRP